MAIKERKKLSEIDFAREKFKAKVLQYKKMPGVPIILSMSVSRLLILDFLRELTGTSCQLCLLGRYIVFNTILSSDLQSPLLVLICTSLC